MPKYTVKITHKVTGFHRLTTVEAADDEKAMAWAKHCVSAVTGWDTIHMGARIISSKHIHVAPTVPERKPARFDPWQLILTHVICWVVGVLVGIQLAASFG